ncbi:T3SS effector Map [Escherichia coli]|nr:T3SS effector Map [Escherichia coli]
MILSVFITVISGHDKPQPPGCLLDVNCAQSSIDHFLQSNKYFNKKVDEHCGKGVDPMTRFNTQAKMIKQVSQEIFEQNFGGLKVSDIKTITQSAIADNVQDTRL